MLLDVSVVVFQDLEFQEDQFAHRDNMQKKLEEIHASIIATMKNTYKVFMADGPEVRIKDMLLSQLSHS